MTVGLTHCLLLAAVLFAIGFVLLSKADKLNKARKTAKT